MYNVDECYNGFVYQGSRKAPNVKGTAHLFKHEVTQAIVIYIECETDKKVFNIAFRTPAKDDTGVTHIIEHSVLEGSKKYPSCEALFHLEKHSVCDDVNAYTSNERTCYHFSSRNQKDFDILFDYYMDGIFNPNFLKDPTIYLREGWHLENRKDGKVEVQGIVFNEMKAHMLNKMAIEYGVARGNVFPGTCYQYEAGGDICAIPTSDYDRACAYYHKYYHPSNSVLCLYGKLDIMKYLKQINDEFYAPYKNRVYTLKNYFECKKKPELVFKGIKPITTPKSIGDEGSDVWFTCAVDKLSRLDKTMLHLMLFYTLSYNEHKVRYTMITKKMCEELHLFMGNASCGTYYGIIFEGVNEKLKEGVVNEYIKLVKKIRDEGIDYKNMKILVKLLKSYYMKDLVDEEYVDEVVELSLYGQDPFEMSIKEVFEIIEDKLKNDLGFFSEYIEDFFVHTKSYCVSVFDPDKQYKKKLLYELEEVVNPKDVKWTKEDRKRIDKVSRILKSSVYASEKPTVTHEELTLDDINTAVKWNDYRDVKILDKDVRAYIIPRSEVSYVRMEFDISNLSMKDSAIFASLSDCLFCNFTKNRSNVDVSYESAYLFEKCDTKMEFTNIIEKDKVKRVLKINLEVLNENIPKAMELLGDIFINSSYGHMKYTYSLIYWSIVDALEVMVEKPNTVIPMVTKSHFSKADNMKNHIMGPMAIDSLCRILEESNSPEGIKKLAIRCQKIFKKVFNASRMSLFIAGSSTGIKSLTKCLNQSLKDFPRELSEEDAEYIPVTRGFAPVTEAASIQSIVQYNSLSIDLRDKMKDFKGSPEVICNYLQEWIVHKLVRETGSAYGSSIKYDDGVFTFTSYRDPSFEKTLDTFVNVGAIFKQFKIIDFDKHKIAVAGRKNLFDDEISKIEAIEGFKRDGRTEEDMKADADKILETTEDDLRYVCDMLTEAAKAGKYNYYSIGDIDTFRHTREGILSRIVVY